MNLRCMQFDKSNVCIYVGGGITSKSIPENEWQELLNKSNTLKSLIDKFE